MHTTPSTTFENITRSKSNKKEQKTGLSLVLLCTLCVLGAAYFQFQPFGRFFLDARQGVLNFLTISLSLTSTFVFLVAASKKRKFVHLGSRILSIGCILLAIASWVLPKSDLLITHQAEFHKSCVFLGFVFLGFVFWWIADEYMMSFGVQRE